MAFSGLASLPSQQAGPSSATVTLSGNWTGPNTTPTISLTISQVGNIVTIKFPPVAQVSSTASAIYIFSVNLPSQFRPSIGFNTMWGCVTNNNANFNGQMTLSTAGQLALYPAPGGGTFTSAQMNSPSLTSGGAQIFTYSLT